MSREFKARFILKRTLECHKDVRDHKTAPFN